MTEPPGNENATGKGGALLTDDTANVVHSAPEDKLALAVVPFEGN